VKIVRHRDPDCAGWRGQTGARRTSRQLSGQLSGGCHIVRNTGSGSSLGWGKFIRSVFRFIRLMAANALRFSCAPIRAQLHQCSDCTSHCAGTSTKAARLLQPIVIRRPPLAQNELVASPAINPLCDLVQADVHSSRARKIRARLDARMPTYAPEVRPWTKHRRSSGGTRTAPQPQILRRPQIRRP
jgi:hypothetical protein